MKINLTIDRIILDSVNGQTVNQGQLQIDIYKKLSHLLTTIPLTTGSLNNTTINSITANSMYIRNLSTNEIGGQIARSVFRGLDHE